MGQTIGRIEILPDPLALAHHVAEWMTQAALAAQGSFRVSLSGGSTPKTLYGLLASDEFSGRFPWQRGVLVLGRRTLRPVRSSRQQLSDDARSDARQGAGAAGEHSSRSDRRHCPTTRRDATSGRCRRPTALQRSIRNARFSMSRCSGLVPMDTPHRCCRESRC